MEVCIERGFESPLFNWFIPGRWSNGSYRIRYSFTAHDDAQARNDTQVLRIIEINDRARQINQKIPQQSLLVAVMHESTPFYFPEC